MEFKYKNYDVDVEITRKKIKNLYIRVKNGVIKVSANTYTSDRYIENLLERERQNIEKMLEKENLKPNDKIFYLGEEFEYKYNEKLIIDESSFSGPSIDIINEHLEKNSLSIFETRLKQLKNMFNDLPDFRLRTRKMKTRWGVCNKKSMIITLNTELIHYDVSLIDYVIIHELCHFKHMDHSKLFWMEVEKYYPYYKLARKRLKQ